MRFSKAGPRAAERYPASVSDRNTAAYINRELARSRSGYLDAAGKLRLAELRADLEQIAEETAAQMGVPYMGRVPDAAANLQVRVSDGLRRQTAEIPRQVMTREVAANLSRADMAYAAREMIAALRNQGVGRVWSSGPLLDVAIDDGIYLWHSQLCDERVIVLRSLFYHESRARRPQVAEPRRDPLDVKHDGQPLRRLLELDALARRENVTARLARCAFTAGQRAAIAAHWSAELRAKVAATRAADKAREVSVYCEVDDL